MYEFSRKNRLRAKRDFQSVFAKPFKLSRKYLVILYRSNQQPDARLGIVLNKRYLKKAVERNQFRRIIRESFRHAKEDLKGLDILVLIRSECTPLDKKALRTDIDKLWQELINSLKPA